MKNVAASVRQRLLDRSRATKEPFQNLLVRYGIERFLFRLSVSERSDDFVLKGANLFYAWTGELLRPTKDLDMLHDGAADLESLVAMVAGIITTDVGDDGPTKIDYPTLLDMASPRLRAYSFESAIAEKVQAMVKLGMANSRMKDFYDVYVLARDFEFDGATLQDALEHTFARRQTPMPIATPIAWTDEFFDEDGKRIQWRAFLRKSRLETLDPTAVAALLRAFLEPVRNAILDARKLSSRWQSRRWT